MSEFERPVCLPVLALRGLCVFPKMLTHFDVGRKSSMAAVEEALREDQQIFLVTQKDVETDHPKRNDLYTVGTVSIVKQVLRLPGENMRILVEGQYRAELLDIVQSEPYLFGRMQKLEELPYNHSLPRVEALLRQAHSQFEQAYQLVAAINGPLARNEAWDVARELLRDGVNQRHQAEHLHFIAESVNGLSHRFHRIDGKMQYHRRLARR